MSFNLSEVVNGFVYFIGAGPGDPGLLTVRGQQILNDADLIIYDRLVSFQILQLLPDETPKICAESLPGCHPERIEVLVNLMVSNAFKGLKIARLKGGDPLLFGRGSEEIEPLIAKSIAFEIVPGVTAALGASAYSGIPLTHREFSSAVAFITGHEKAGKPDSFLQWPEIAKFPGTLVFYMGVKRAQVIQSNLLEQGMNPQTPVAIISDTTLPQQKQANTILGNLTTLVVQENFAPPAVIIIGSAANHLGLWGWRNKLPLGNASVLISRPKGQGVDFSAKLKNLGANVFQFDSMIIKNPEDWSLVDGEIKNLSTFDWLVFTSANGVEKFLQRFLQLGFDIRTLLNLKIACIGPSTAIALKTFHIYPDLIPPRHDAEGLIEALFPLVKGRKVLLARAKEGRPLLSQELSKICQITDLHVYSQTPAPQEQIANIKSMLSNTVLDYVAVTSSNSARALYDSLGESVAEGILAGKTKVVAISPLTSEEVKKLGWGNALSSKNFTTEGMIEEMVNDWSKIRYAKNFRF
ncbi:MAG: uroporphyrinogen-III C-methyltransferase [Planctomycetes bacterium]|nr:uroporphyrinogen-III C-methyltransferase [Planctomycetota bacterium]